MTDEPATESDWVRIDALADHAIRALDATWDRLARTRDAEDAQRVEQLREQFKTNAWLETIAARLQQ